MLCVAGCTQYATVHQKRPEFRPSSSTTASIQPVEKSIFEGLKVQRRAPMEALENYLSAADNASQQLQKNPSGTEARDAYNFAVSRLITTLEDAKLDAWTKPLQVPSQTGGYVITTPVAKQKIANPALYNFTPVDQFDVKGTYVSERTVKPGVGAPLVAIGKEQRKDAKEEFALAQTYYGITAVVKFSAIKGTTQRKADVNFIDPLSVETVSLDGHTYPLGADFTSPLAVMLAQENPKKLELSRLLRPEKYAETAHIVRLQPFDPNKIVVIVVHGLMDTPATWTPMLNTLRGDAYVRAHYQFWFYSYPSGYPYPYSAAILRHNLDAIEKRFPVRKPIVLIGHSMGSLISRLMITDSGDKLWLNIFGEPPDKMQMTAKSRKILEDALIFNHRPEIGRVIFISGPHRGSEFASNWIGRLGSKLVKAPSTLLSVSNDIRKALLLDTSSLQLRGVPNSVDTLAPNNRFVKAINTIPITPGIPYHSIMGDRGKGGNKDHTKPVSTDGIVPYWSSHLDGAQSELIVPSAHNAHQNPKAIAEVDRILHLNAGDTGKK